MRRLIDALRWKRLMKVMSQHDKCLVVGLKRAFESCFAAHAALYTVWTSEWPSVVASPFSNIDTQ